MDTEKPDPAFAAPNFRPELTGARLWYVPNRGRSARPVCVYAYAQTLADELDKMQEQLGGESVTVCVQLANGDYFAHVGPMYYARHAALTLAGVRNLPTYGPNRHA